MGNPPLDWQTAAIDQTGYYDLLAQGFVSGHLYLPIEPAPELLALADPWDPARNRRYAAPDLALYGGRYYLYHGPVPAVFLFAPWRFITKRDLPQGFAVFLFCTLGYVFSAATLLRLLRSTDARPRLRFFGLLLLALGVCQGSPFLLERASVYEVAISGGYCFVSVGFWFLLWGLSRSDCTALCSALAGLILGLAIGCRPDLVFTGVFGCIALFWVLRNRAGTMAAIRSREFAALAGSFAVSCLLIAAYNYARFADPLEFGMRFEMATPAYFRPHPAIENLKPGLYYLLICHPVLEPVFPFFRLAIRLPFDLANFALPKRYFLEPIAGAIVVWPFTALALAPSLLPRTFPKISFAARTISQGITLAATACVVFIASLGLVSHRFEMDYQPQLVLVACFALGAARLRPWRLGITIALLLYSIVVCLAIGLEGPYGTFLQLHPRTYVRVARWFSPIERFRPTLDPAVTVKAAFKFPAGYSGSMPLLAAGRIGGRYSLSATEIGERTVRLTSYSALDSSQETADVPLVEGAPNDLRFDYSPEDHTINVRWNGQLVKRHRIAALVTAPAQVTVGEDYTDFHAIGARFPGTVQVEFKTVNGNSYN